MKPGTAGDGTGNRGSFADVERACRRFLESRGIRELSMAEQIRDSVRQAQRVKRLRRSRREFAIEAAAEELESSWTG